ncbi:MAG: Imm27 family immunity protein [Dokdonella sp.]|uniref:Imm27 family immunity protein n=1 Tax=Dokdonella sp. TaxID=2291710 RepID=UPI003BB11CE0
MKKLQPAETDLVGDWVLGNKGLQADETTKRIEWLTSSALEKISDSPQWGAWETLFRDPDDERLWERTYPKGEMHGGGPPTLKNISPAQARAKYGIACERGLE